VSAQTSRQWTTPPRSCTHFPLGRSSWHGSTKADFLLASKFLHSFGTASRGCGGCLF